MIPLRFYRDDKNVYYNNPDGTTKSMTIQEFEEHFSGGSGGLPEYDSGNAGEVLSVDAGGDLTWRTLPPGGGVTYFDATVDYVGQSVNCDVTKADISRMLNSGSHPVIRFNAPEGGATIYEPLDSVYGDDTNGSYSFQKYVTFMLSGSPQVLSVLSYILILLEWYEEDDEMVTQWTLDYVFTG